MAIQLAIEDTTGVEMPESYHMITSVHTDGLAQTFVLKIQVWASAAAFAAGKTPINYDGWGRDFFLIHGNQADYAAISTPLVDATDLNQPVRSALLKRAYQWLMQQNKERTVYFDYTNGQIA